MGQTVLAQGVLMGSDVVQAAWIRADSVILCEMIRREKKIVH